MHHRHQQDDAYMIFVFLLTPEPFSADTKNTLIPDFLTPKYTKFKIFIPNTIIHIFFDKRLKMLTPALPVVPGTNLRYG